MRAEAMAERGKGRWEATLGYTREREKEREMDVGCQKDREGVVCRLLREGRGPSGMFTQTCVSSTTWTGICAGRKIISVRSVVFWIHSLPSRRRWVQVNWTLMNLSIFHAVPVFAASETPTVRSQGRSRPRTRLSPPANRKVLRDLAFPFVQRCIVPRREHAEPNCARLFPMYPNGQ